MQLEIAQNRLQDRGHECNWDNQIMMQTIGFWERLALTFEKMALAKRETQLRSRLIGLVASGEYDRSAASLLMQARCDLTDRITQIELWLVQQARPA